ELQQELEVHRDAVKKAIALFTRESQAEMSMEQVTEDGLVQPGSHGPFQRLEQQVDVVCIHFVVVRAPRIEGFEELPQGVQGGRQLLRLGKRSGREIAQEATAQL